MNQLEIKPEEALSSRNIKPTANRILVARELLKCDHPLSLADLEMALYPMDKASIFRVLELFAARELVHVIEDGSRSLKYELCHTDGPHQISDQHIHFFCEECKETFCLENIKVPMVDTPIGFTQRSVNYVIKGLCPKCSK